MKGKEKQRTDRRPPWGKHFKKKEKNNITDKFMQWTTDNILY